MAKPEKNTAPKTQDEAFEIIELAVNDIETLARAFELIGEMCVEMAGEDAPLEELKIPETLLN